MIKAIIFDVDETLVDSTSVHFEAWDAAFAPHNRSMHDVPKEIFATFMGRRIPDIIAVLCEYWNIKEDQKEIYARRQKKFMENVSKIGFMPGAKELLEKLKETEYTLAVVSSGGREYVTQVLTNLNVINMFSVIVTGDDVQQGKPHPEPFQKAVEGLKIPADQCLVFEDAGKGVESAKAAGCKCIGVPYSKNPPQDFSKADDVIGSLNDFTIESLKENTHSNTKMNVLVTGAGGFMGYHLVEKLAQKGHTVYGTYFTPTADVPNQANMIECDVRDTNKVLEIMQKAKPQQVFHLAAQSLPTVSWEKPGYTIEVNMVGTVNIYEAIKTIRKQDPSYDPVVIVACSSAEYGYVKPEETPVKETRILKPLHPYGVSKVGQELLMYQYFANDKIKGIAARIFNTTGPRKVNDVCSDFVRRIVDIEKGKNPNKTVTHGNLETRRGITDVRDLINALTLLAEKGTPGEAYNLCGEKAYKIGDIIAALKQMANTEFNLEVDPKLIRPTDEPIIMGDTTKLKEHTGWEQTIPIETTLKDMLEFWRGYNG